MKYDVFDGKIGKKTLSIPDLPRSELSNLSKFDGISRKK